MPPLRTDLPDGALIEQTRRGDRAAYGELWNRHAASARTVARSYSSLDPDDLVAESFTKIYDAILRGGGPTGAFRPYLFTTLRNTAASWGRGQREATLETLESFEDPATSEAATLDSLDRSTTAQAFRSLPTRWQEVLWYSEVEGMAPQQIAPLVGMSANATAALAYRAREGLRQAWIQAHLRNAEGEPECRWTVNRLGGYTRGKLRARDTARLETHLDDCARCTIVAAEAREVGSRLALVLLPLAAGVGGATAYSAWLSQGAPVVHLAMGAAGLPAVLVGAPGVGGGAGGAAAGGSAASGAAGAASGATAGSIGASGIVVGAGVGTLVVAAAAVAVFIAVPYLTAAETPPAAVAQPAGEVAPPAPSPALPVTAAPAPVAPSPIPDALPESPAVTASADVVAPAPTPAPVAEPVVTPVPQPVAPSAPSFEADTAGGLVDPLLTGTAEPGAIVVVADDDGRTWTATADAAGIWSVVADHLSAGVTFLTATQTDVSGTVSPASDAVAVELSAPSLTLRRSGHLVWHAAFSGAPGASVEVLLGEEPFATLELDGSGAAKAVALTGSDELAGAVVRYTAGGRTGPAAGAIVETD